jgi:hypothetical protein
LSGKIASVDREGYGPRLQDGDPQTVIAGDALAHAAFEEPLFAHEPAVDPGDAFAALGLRGVSIETLVQRTAEETDLLDGLLSVD